MNLRLYTIAGLATLLPALSFASTVTVTNDLPSIGIAGVKAEAVVGGPPAIASKALDAKPIISVESENNGVPTTASGMMLPTTNFSEQVVAKSAALNKVQITVNYAIQYAVSSKTSAGGLSIDLPDSQTYDGQVNEQISLGAQKLVAVDVPNGPKLILNILVSK